MLRYRYLADALLGQYSRPFVPLRIRGTAVGLWHLPRALADTGADDTVFPLSVAELIQPAWLAEPTFLLRWHGSEFALRFGLATLELREQNEFCRWKARLGFTDAPLPYPLLGRAGCLQYFDVTFRGADRIVDFEPNDTFPGETQLTVKS